MILAIPHKERFTNKYCKVIINGEQNGEGILAVPHVILEGNLNFCLEKKWMK